MKKRGAFFYILIALAFLAIGALIYLLAPGNEPETPAVLLPPAAAPEQDSGNAPGGETLPRIEVTPDTVQTVIGTLRRADSYSRSLTLETFWSGGKRTRLLDVWAQGDCFRIAERGDTVKTVLLSGDEKWIWYSDREGVFHGSVREGDDDAYQTLLTYEDILTLPKQRIREAGYTDYDGTECIFVRYTDDLFQYEHCCYIAVETGLLMGQESYDGDTLIYAMHSTAPDISTQDEALFQPPVG